MIRIEFTARFKKRYKKYSHKFQSKVDERVVIFIENPLNDLLNNHKLKGKFKGCCSINITGDIRAIYEEVGKDIYFFIELGTHSELYGK